MCMHKISISVTLQKCSSHQQYMRPSFKLALPVTRDVGNLSCKFKRCTVFHFQTNDGPWTDRQTNTDGWGAMNNAASYRRAA